MPVFNSPVLSARNDFITQLRIKQAVCYFERMIVIGIREQAEKRGLTTAYQLQNAMGISPTIAARLWRGDFDKIGIVTLNRLCRVLRCQPNKLLRYVPDEE